MNQKNKPDLLNDLMTMEPAKVLQATEHLPGNERQDAILTNIHAEQVVQMMHLEDLYLLIKDIGEQDSLALLELASSEQVEGLFDLEVWVKDNLEPQRAAKWFNLLMQLNDEQFLLHLKNLDRAMVLAYLMRYIKVFKRDETYDPIESDKMFFVTPDNRYYLEYVITQEESRTAIEIIERLYRLDFEFFHLILEGIFWEITTNCDEMAYQEKVRRLADYGFPDYFSALDIIAIRDPKTFEIKKRQHSPVSMLDVDTPPPAFMVLSGNSEALLDRALKRLDPQSAYDLRWEMAFVANRFLVARQVDFSEVRNVINALDTVHNRLNLGLEYLSSKNLDTAVATLENHLGRDLFIMGNSLVGTLGRQCKKYLDELKETWGLSGELLFEHPYREFLAELASETPKYFLGIDQKDLTGSRDFAGLDDFRAADDLLARLVQLTDAFSCLLPDRRLDHDVMGTNLTGVFEVRLGPLLLAGLAHFILDGKFRLAPLDPKRLAEFANLAFTKDADQWTIKSDFNRRISEPLKQLALTSGTDAPARIEPFIREFLEDAADEIGHLSADSRPEPAYIRTIWLKLNQ